MSITNTASSYGWVSIAIHWVMAAAIFFMFGLGLYMVELSYYDAWYKGSLSLHKSIGLVLFFVLLFRITWRVIHVAPATISHKRWEVWVAHITHLALYVFILLILISGYLISTADGRGIDVFGLFDMPALPFSIDNQESIAGDIHEILAWSLIALVTVHAGAALKHHFIERDKTLIRILKP